MSGHAPRLDALRENETFAAAERRKRDERFRAVLASDPDLTTEQLSERFGMAPKDIRAWCQRLGLPMPPNSLGEYALGRRGRGAVKHAVEAHRSRR